MARENRPAGKQIKSAAEDESKHRRKIRAGPDPLRASLAQKQGRRGFLAKGGPGANKKPARRGSGAETSRGSACMKSSDKCYYVALNEAAKVWPALSREKPFPIGKPALTRTSAPKPQIVKRRASHASRRPFRRNNDG